jgi:hypothetical protein
MPTRMKNTKAEDVIASIEEDRKELREVVALDRDVVYNGVLTGIKSGASEHGNFAILEWDDATISFTSGDFETLDAQRFANAVSFPVEVTVVRTQKVSEKTGNAYNKMYLRVIE